MSSEDGCGKGSFAEVEKVSLLFPLVLRLRNVGLSRWDSSWRAISLCGAIRFFSFRDAQQWDFSHCCFYLRTNMIFIGKG